MKKVFILFLLFSAIICKSRNSGLEITDIIKCLLNSDLIKKSIEKIISIINSKDISIMIKTFIYLYKEFKNETIKCTNNSLKQSSNEKDENIDDIKLGYPKSVYVLYTQIGEKAFIWYEQGGMTYLKEQCHLEFGQRTWYCVYLSST